MTLTDSQKQKVQKFGNFLDKVRDADYNGFVERCYKKVDRINAFITKYLVLMFLCLVGIAFLLAGWNAIKLFSRH